MSSYSFFNSASNQQLLSLLNSANFQTYLNNGPSTLYTLKNLFETAPGSGISRNLVANDGTTTSQDIVLFNNIGGTAFITVPAGTYNITMKMRINILDASPSNITYGELVVYNAIDPTVKTIKIASSSSSSFVQSVNSGLTFVDINHTQRIVLSASTNLSMYYEYSNSVGIHTVVYGSSGGIDYTTSMTLQPTI